MSRKHPENFTFSAGDREVQLTLNTRDQYSRIQKLDSITGRIRPHTTVTASLPSQR